MLSKELILNFFHHFNDMFKQVQATVTATL